MATPAPLRVLEWNAAAFKRLWRASVLTSFLQPILYLLAMGIGVGALVDKNSGGRTALQGLSYAAFVGPGLLATTAMMVGSIESMWPVLDGMTMNRQYQAMAATPLGSSDIVRAHLIWILFRTGVAAATVAAVMALFPDVRAWGLLPAIPVAMLLGAAFSMPLAAFTVTRQRDMAFPIIQRFVITPLFLFGGAFFPLSQLPLVIRSIGYATPLWHGVELCRSLISGTSVPAAAALGHVAYLTAFVVVGTVVMRSRMERKLFA